MRADYGAAHLIGVRREALYVDGRVVVLGERGHLGTHRRERLLELRLHDVVEKHAAHERTDVRFSVPR